ncbi:ABC transporter ATP-binding protein [Echinicola strongylocentroti]|uniref:ABC transporter ATP-binding protein n=1 Tax=Echinicola strongylocentroti TaxID=1795355 RepID=A0A2Z4IN92_9BACT|nr:ABC transporter ATP-binding protein [Echinicola strongylocentroti]AWW32056.1 ABC transporter ATP-binding protein [Echinicola strongylocentroti]
MGKSIIQVENLSKRYRLGLKEKRSKTLAGQVGNIIKSPWENFQRLRKLSKFGEEDESVFWALKDISFEVKEGEVLGIIGKNGAGKSTLLKILSQITEPTSGKITLNGRVASLLEVGTGFHPELTGRENIYMNGTILGMTRREIDRKLDEIIDFSGIEKFVDTPVKFYSSGMKVRLGFSVAAHLEPEILIIDEVLAVGDYEFQQKCLGKMEDVSKNQGRTVLFVSHNMAAVQNLCSRGILMGNGKLHFDGVTEEALKSYIGGNTSTCFLDLENAHIKGEGNQKIKLKSINLSSRLDEDIPVFPRKDVYISLDVDFKEGFKNQGERIDIRIDNRLGQRLIWCSTKADNRLKLGTGKITFKIPQCPLVPDEYVLTVFIHDGHDVANWYPQVMNFKVEEAAYFDSGMTIPNGQTSFIYPFELTNS